MDRPANKLEARERIAEAIIPEKDAIARFLYIDGGRDDVLLRYIPTPENHQPTE